MKTKLLLILLLISLVIVAGCTKQQEKIEETTTTMDAMENQRYTNLATLDMICEEVAKSDWNITDVGGCDFGDNIFLSHSDFPSKFSSVGRYLNGEYKSPITELALYGECSCSYRKIISPTIRRENSYMEMEIEHIRDFRFKLNKEIVLRMLYKNIPKEEYQDE